jgi:hypothetical protein
MWWDSSAFKRWQGEPVQERFQLRFVFPWVCNNKLIVSGRFLMIQMAIYLIVLGHHCINECFTYIATTNTFWEGHSHPDAHKTASKPDISII